MLLKKMPQKIHFFKNFRRFATNFSTVQTKKFLDLIALLFPFRCRQSKNFQVFKIWKILKDIKISKNPKEELQFKINKL